VSEEQGSFDLGLKLDVSNDKYILNFMRMHVIDKASNELQTEGKTTFYTRETGIKNYS